MRRVAAGLASGVLSLALTYCSSVPDVEFVDDGVPDGSSGGDGSTGVDGSNGGDAASDAPETTCVLPEPANATKCCDKLWCEGNCNNNRCNSCEGQCNPQSQKCCVSGNNVTCKDPNDPC